MMTTSLNITNKIESDTLTVLRSVSAVALNLDMPFFVVGATALDLVLRHCYGAKITRTTQDIDIAFQVPDWTAFEALNDNLLNSKVLGTKPKIRFNTHGLIFRSSTLESLKT